LAYLSIAMNLACLFEIRISRSKTPPFFHTRWCAPAPALATTSVTLVRTELDLARETSA
jgi:hypothetical protein